METLAGKKDKIRRDNYTTILLSATMTTVTHPIHMTKVLIQVFTFQISINLTNDHYVVFKLKFKHFLFNTFNVLNVLMY